MIRTLTIVNRWIVLCLVLVTGTSCMGLKNKRPPNGPLTTLMQEIEETERSPLRAQKQEVMKGYEELLQQYGQMNPDHRAEAMKRFGDLSLQTSQKLYMTQMESYEKHPDGPPPILHYDHAIQSYRALIASHPDFPETDRVLYSLAKALTETGRREEGTKYLERLVRDYPNSSYLQEAYFRLGEVLFDEHDYLEAARTYEKALTLGDPYFIDKARYKLGWAYFNLQDYPSAIKEFLWLLDEKTDPRQDLADQNVPLAWEALTYAAISFRNRGGPLSAAQYFRERGPRYYEKDLYLLMGNHYMAASDPQKGILTYQTFMTEHPLHPMAAVFASYVLEAYEKHQEQEAALKTRLLIVEKFNTESPWFQANDGISQSRARPLVKEALHRLALDAHHRAQKSHKEEVFREAIHWYQRFLKEFPKEAESRNMHFLLAEALYDTEQFGAAATAYETVAFHYPSLGLDQKAGYNAIVSYEKAGGHDNLQKMIELTQTFADAYPKDPRSPDLLLKSAEILLDQDEIAKSENVLKKLLANDTKGPVAPKVHRLLGFIYTQQGRYEEARDAYGRARDLTPSENTKARQELTKLMATVLFKLGDLHKVANRPLDAARAYDAVSVEAPSDDLAPVALFEAATLYESMDRPQEALRIYKRLVQIAPDSENAGRAKIQVGLLYERQGDKRKAAAAYQSAIPLIKDSREVPQLLWHSATLLEESAEWDLMHDALSEYMKRFPQDEKIPEALFKRAEAYQKQGKEKEARTLFEKVEARAPGTLLAAKAILQRAEVARRDYQKIRLKEPMAKSLKQKTKALERVVELYTQAAQSRFAEVVTVSAYQLGDAFEHYRTSLLEAPLPREISPEMEEEYRFQVEEKAYPFEEKAVEAYRSNVQRIYDHTAIYNDWIKKSYGRLADLRPGLYRRPEETEKIVIRIDPLSLHAKGTVYGHRMLEARR